MTFIQASDNYPVSFSPLACVGLHCPFFVCLFCCFYTKLSYCNTSNLTQEQAGPSITLQLLFSFMDAKREAQLLSKTQLYIKLQLRLVLEQLQYT